MRIDTLEEFYVESLKDLYHAEHQVLRALPKMASAATSPELRTLIQRHSVETRTHVDRLDTIFDGIMTDPMGKQCKAMAGLLAQSDEAINGDISDIARDAALISAAQRIEHYEMAGYGSLLTYARTLGEREAAGLLNETLREDGDFANTLALLAEAPAHADSNWAAAI